MRRVVGCPGSTTAACGRAAAHRLQLSLTRQLHLGDDARRRGRALEVRRRDAQPPPTDAQHDAQYAAHQEACRRQDLSRSCDLSLSIMSDDLFAGAADSRHRFDVVKVLCSGLAKVASAEQHAELAGLQRGQAGPTCGP